MTRQILHIGLPIVAAGIAIPSGAQAQTADAVATSMEAFANATAGSNGAARAKAKQAHYLAHKDAEKSADCTECNDCGSCETCTGCAETHTKEPQRGKVQHG